MTDLQSSEYTPGNVALRSTLAWPVVLAILFVLAAAWLAAGSTGLLAHPLRLSLMWVALGGAACAATYGSRVSGPRVLAILAGIGAAVLLSSSLLPPVTTASVALVAALLGLARPGSKTEARALRVAATAVLVFALYRMLLTALPGLWLLGDGLGHALGRAIQGVSGRALWVGATFGGLDFLVLMGALYLAWLVAIPGSRILRGVAAGLALLLAHAVYLLVVAHEADARAYLELHAKTPFWSWLEILVPLLPWNLPALAGVLHLAVAGALFRWTRSPEPASLSAVPGHPLVRYGIRASVLVGILALTVLVARPRGRCSLEKNKIVAFKECFGNWDKPKHGDYGRLSIGMYGMLDPYVRSLGGEFLLSEDLSEKDLEGAHVVILLYPHRPFEPGQLGRIWKFVRDGGSLLVLGEHTTCSTGAQAIAEHLVRTFCDRTGLDLYEDYSAQLRIEAAAGKAEKILALKEEHRVQEPGIARGEAGPLDLDVLLTRKQLDAMRSEIDRIDNRFNEVIQDTAMRVRFDSATFAVGGWLHSYTAMNHLSTAGIQDGRNTFGVVIGASVETSWPARPLLVGKWGWNDPGDLHGGPSMMGNHHYDGGEKLGDLVLAAEQSLGKGVVVVFGDTSHMTNGITMGSYLFTSRLLGYLACGPGNLHTTGWHVLGILLGGVLAAVLLILLRFSGGSIPLALAALCLGGALVVCTDLGRKRGVILPDGRLETPNNLAYIDTTHMERNDSESWRMDGLMGLRLTLMRSGYLTLDLPEFTKQRLERAGLVVAVAPHRTYTPEEVQCVRAFVESGGIYILTVSQPDAGPSRPLLEAFHFDVGAIASAPGREVQPMSHFKSPYYNAGDYMLQVRFHEAWPVACTAPNTPPPSWFAEPKLDGRGLLRFSSWFTDHALASVLPWAETVEPARVLAYGTGNHPVILMRRVGLGKFVVVGDTGFAMNKNLEIEGGQAFEGMRENPHFWRWFLGVLRDQEPWIPPRPVPVEEKEGR